jgi:ornithine cyclodeaminase/alanine dehydrogenase-like protein (mu-crystallin family)
VTEGKVQPCRCGTSIPANSLPFIDAARLRDLVTFGSAADALAEALRDGLDPESEPDRSKFAMRHGGMLLMPSEHGSYATVKLVTVGGSPFIQGVAVVFDAATLSPVALIDGIALTDLRTPAVSLLATRHLVRLPARHLVVFGRGAQGSAHVRALLEEFTFAKVTILHSRSGASSIEAAISEADVICCATTARVPLFDGRLVKDSALVIGVGSHEPTATELDPALVRRSTIAVESRRAAMREAGDIVMAEVPASEIISLAELIGGVDLPADGPRLFKSTGMSWEDSVVAGLAVGKL